MYHFDVEKAIADCCAPRLLYDALHSKSPMLKLS